MAGDWIKMTTGLRTHPKVVRMASALRADKLRVIGGLFAVWSIFDAHSADGMLEGYSFKLMDDELAWRGFCAAMQGIGWLDETPGGLVVPRYDEHHSAGAKRRALDTERKRVDRKGGKSSASGPQSVLDLSASDADKKRTREEKRREEPSITDGEDSTTVAPTAAPPPPDCDDGLPEPTQAGRACLACRGANVHDVNPAHPELLRLLADGATPEEIGATAVECAARGRPRFAYVLATVGRRRSEAAAGRPVGSVAAPVAGCVTVPSRDAERTAELLRQQAERGVARPSPEVLERLRSIRGQA